MEVTEPLNGHHRRLREICLVLPGAFETIQIFEHRVFKVGEKTILWFDDSCERLIIKTEPEARQILLQDRRFESLRTSGGTDGCPSKSAPTRIGMRLRI